MIVERAEMPSLFFGLETWVKKSAICFQMALQGE